MKFRAGKTTRGVKGTLAVPRTRPSSSLHAQLHLISLSNPCLKPWLHMGLCDWMSEVQNLAMIHGQWACNSQKPKVKLSQIWGVSSRLAVPAHSCIAGWFWPHSVLSLHSICPHTRQDSQGRLQRCSLELTIVYWALQCLRHMGKLQPFQEHDRHITVGSSTGVDSTLDPWASSPSPLTISEMALNLLLPLITHSCKVTFSASLIIKSKC